MDTNRKDFYNKVLNKKKDPSTVNSPLIMSGKDGKQLNYDNWVKTFFGDETIAGATLGRLKKTSEEANNWVDREIPEHKKNFVDIETFIKTYCCDLEWAKSKPYCAGSSGGTGDAGNVKLDEYIGFYTGLDDEGKTQRQEITIDGGKLVSSVRKKPAGKINIILTPTSIKDVFKVELKNMMIKTSSGTATFKRNKDGKVCSVVSSVKATAINNEEVSMDATASKEGVSCDGPTPAPDNQGQGNNQQGNNQQGNAQVNQATGPNNFPICVDEYGIAVTVYLVMDKSNNKPFSFAQDDDDTKAKQMAEKIIADNPTKQLEIKVEEGRMEYINQNFDIGKSGAKTARLILLKDYTFVSDSSVKRGTYQCTEYNGRRYVQPLKRERIINEEDAKEFLTKQFIRITKLRK